MQQTSARTRAMPNYQQQVEISLQEAYSGAQRSLQMDKKHVEIRIPAGVKTGSKVRVAGAAPDRRDLYLIVEVADDPRFEHDGDNLRTSATTDVFTALLGGEAEVETLEGKVKLKDSGGHTTRTGFSSGWAGPPRLKSSQGEGGFIRPGQSKDSETVIVETEIIVGRSLAA